MLKKIGSSPNPLVSYVIIPIWKLTMSDKFQFHLYPHMSPELPMLWCLSQVKIGETLEVRMG